MRRNYILLELSFSLDPNIQADDIDLQSQKLKQLENTNIYGLHY